MKQLIKREEHTYRGQSLRGTYSESHFVYNKEIQTRQVHLSI